MSRASAIGTDWENRVRDYLRPIFPDVERAPRWGAKDKGDLLATGDFLFECKARKEINLAGWIKEAQIEAGNAEKAFPVVVAKRRNHQVKDAYVVMPFWAFRLLLSEVVNG